MISSTVPRSEKGLRKSNNLWAHYANCVLLLISQVLESSILNQWQSVTELAYVTVPEIITHCICRRGIKCPDCLLVGQYLLGPVHKLQVSKRNFYSHQMFSIHTTVEKLKTQQSPLILDLWLRETRSGKSRDYWDAVFKVFSVHKKAKSWHFQIPAVWKVFSKSTIFGTVSVHGRPNRRNKTPFSNFS